MHFSGAFGCTKKCMGMFTFQQTLINLL
jgi:hypothetical protein